MDYFIVVLLVACSGLFSGLTLGFFSLNRDDLARKAKLGDRQAVTVYSIRKKGNLILTTLLIGNVAVNAAIPLFLNKFASGVVAGLTATVLIVILGEILPQATFSRFALTLGEKMAPLVRLLLFLFYPLAKPIAWGLDKMLGQEMATVYSKRELIRIIEEHEDNSNSDIDADEEKIIKGALSFSEKRVKDVMTPRTEMYALAAEAKLTKKSLDQIFKSGHSRIPVYEDRRDHVVGVLYVKDLIKLNGNSQKMTMADIARDDVIYVDEEKKLDDLLNAFKKTRHHLFVVLDDMGMVSGLVTIEDVIEEIIGEEIVDEFDQHANLRDVAEKKLRKKKLNKV